MCIVSPNDVYDQFPSYKYFGRLWPMFHRNNRSYSIMVNPRVTGIGWHSSAMASNSSIEWTETTWNPITGCTKISPGCDNCYAIRDAHRLSGNPNLAVHNAYKGTTHRLNDRTNWAGILRTIPSRLEQPLQWKKPRRIF